MRIAKEIEAGAVGLFLIGAVMTLQTGGNIKCQPRLIEGIEFDGWPTAERLILDGQQRLASLYQALTLPRAKLTRDEKNEAPFLVEIPPRAGFIRGRSRR